MSLLKQIQERFRPNPDDLPVVLELDLARGVLTQTPTNPLIALRERTATSLGDIRTALVKATDDDNVVGLIVHVGICPLPLGDNDEVAELIAAFDKPVIAWSETFGELVGDTAAYRLACAADEIWLQPSGTVGLSGYRAQITLLRGPLEKLGVTPQFEQRKEFKSAGEQFGGTEVSEANREMTQRLVDSLLADTVRTIATARGVPESRVRELVDQSPLSPQTALDADLIDHIGYRDEVFTSLRERYGHEGESGRHVHLTYVHRYRQRPRFAQFTEADRPAIGLVSAHGAIVLGPTKPSMNGTPCGTDTLAAQLRAAGHDENIQAVVLRVDSPGGSAVGSDQIRREVHQLRRTKPVIVSMGNVAASGGYYIAMGATKIVANRSTLTGSIGVVGGKFVLDQLRENIGLIQESRSAGARAAMWDNSAFTDDGLAVLNAWLDEVYADFTRKAAEDRDMAVDDLERLARGRVWTGSDAHTNGLIDEIGGVATALRLAAESVDADLADLAIKRVPSLPWLDQIRPPESSEANTAPVALDLGPQGLFRAAAQELGLTVPMGALSLPGTWRITS